VKILIKNAKVICPVQNIDDKKDILIENGIIKDIAKPGTFSDKDAEKVIDAAGMIAAPGLVDMHTHLREPGHEGAETIATGTLAGAAGGFTSVAAMPNTHPVNDNPYVTAYMKTKAKEEGVIKVYPIGAITEKQEGTQLAEIGEMIKAGIVAVSDDGECVMNSYVMRKAMDYCKQFNIPVIDHCEDTNLKGEGVMNEGYYSMKLGLRGIPAVSEEIMVARDISLAHHTGCRTHIAHVSSAGSIRIISEGKQAGIPVTAEVTPHHLFLTEEAVVTYDPNTKMSPPLRTKEDTKAMRLALKNGIIDAIATDHAPHSVEKKDVEFQLSNNGIIGLETSLAWCLKLVHEGDLTLMQLIKVMSTNPAKILGLNAGSLEKGKPADVVIFNPTEEWTYEEDKILSKSKNTPLKGHKFKGKVKFTICDGKIVWQG